MSADHAAAQAAADAGMARAVERADREQPGWSDSALLALLEYADAAVVPFTAETARRHIHDAGLPPPPDARAWGAVIRRASRLGRIQRAGYAPRACGHNTPCPLWSA